MKCQKIIEQYLQNSKGKVCLENIITKEVWSLSHVRLFVTPGTAAHQAFLSITNSQSPPKPMSIVSVMPSNHLILCCPLLLLPSIFPRIRVFSKESALCIRWPKNWSFSINPFSEYSGLSFFGIVWFDLVVQGTLKSILQHHNSKASNLRHSAFFIVQLSHPYITTGKTLTLTIQTCVSKVICLDSSNLGSSIRGLEKWDLMSSLSNFYFTINEA